jgi:hypothetical protein
MKTHLQSVLLKTGEALDILRVTAPDEEYRERILRHLHHKGEPWQTPMELNLQGDLEGLAQHFYLGVVGEEVVGNASSIEALQHPVGILQHVFTPPERRRLGICSSIIGAYAADFDARGGRAAYLHTEYDSTAYHIYRSAGFVGWRDTGIMERFPDPKFAEDFWAVRPVTVRDTRWADWALLEALYAIEEGGYLRSLYARQWGRSGYEGQYVHHRKDLAEGRIAQWKVLEAANGAIVGQAFIARDRTFRGDTWLLDVFLHPSYLAEGGRLLAALNLDLDAKLQAWCDSGQPEQAALLEAAGFSLEATLPRQVRRGDKWLELRLYAR